MLRREACTDCHDCFPVVCMDFDHRDPETKIKGIMTMVSLCRPWDEIETELAKCDLVCANCHRMRTSKQQFGLLRKPVSA